MSFQKEIITRIEPSKPNEILISDGKGGWKGGKIQNKHIKNNTIEPDKAEIEDDIVGNSQVLGIYQGELVKLATPTQTEAVLMYKDGKMQWVTQGDSVFGETIELGNSKFAGSLEVKTNQPSTILLINNSGGFFSRVLNMDGNKIKNFAQSTISGDLVQLSQLNNLIKANAIDNINMNNFRITNIMDGSDNDDLVNINQMNTYCAPNSFRNLYIVDIQKDNKPSYQSSIRFIDASKSSSWTFDAYPRQLRLNNGYVCMSPASIPSLRGTFFQTSDWTVYVKVNLNHNPPTDLSGNELDNFGPLNQSIIRIDNNINNQTGSIYLIRNWTSDDLLVAYYSGTNYGLVNSSGITTIFDVEMKDSTSYYSRVQSCFYAWAGCRLPPCYIDTSGNLDYTDACYIFSGYTPVGVKTTPPPPGKTTIGQIPPLITPPLRGRNNKINHYFIYKSTLGYITVRMFDENRVPVQLSSAFGRDFEMRVDWYWKNGWNKDIPFTNYSTFPTAFNLDHIWLGSVIGDTVSNTYHDFGVFNKVLTVEEMYNVMLT